MSKEIYISSTPHETRLAIVEKDELSEIYYERENEYTLAGSIYNGRVTRVLPGMQSAFVDVGLERDAFLYITDFLEEQGESADFESSEGRRGGERAPERGADRGSERAPERASDRGERNERGGERRRGDRGPRPVVEAREGAEETGPNALRQAEMADEAEPQFPVEGAPERALTTPAAEPAEEDAEGSRRWRGRRGRRRGRGGEARTATPGNEPGNQSEQTTEAQTASAEDETAGGVLDELHGGSEPIAIQAQEPAAESRPPREERGRDRDRGRGRGGRDRGRDRDRADVRTESRPEIRPEIRTDIHTESRTEDRADHRVGNRPGEHAGGREGDRSPEATSGGPASEPFILPGESLSKYRRGADGESGVSASASASGGAQVSFLTAPSTQIAPSMAGWDGGSVLPGETLGRRGDRGDRSARDGGRGQQRSAPASAAVGASVPAEAKAEAKAESRMDVERSAAEEALAGNGADARSRRRDRDRRSGRAGREEGAAPAETAEAIPTQFRSGAVAREALEPMHPMDAVQPGVTTQHDLAETENAYTDREEQGRTQPADVFYEASTDAATTYREGPGEDLLKAVEELHETVAAASEPRVVPFAEEFQEETQEYEPGEEASASYRVDPAGPSEFRQGSLVEDDLNSSQVRFDEGSEVAQEGPSHEFTAIQPGGEMLSEPPPELPGEVAIPGVTEDPTNPIEHETAVQSAYLGDVQASAEATTQTGEAAVGDAEPEAAEEVPRAVTAQSFTAEMPAPGIFAPGDGELEEELLDEDELEALDMTASFGDDVEEETFEAGAEIGSMVRDRALDQMTSVIVPDEEEEGDFDIDEEEMEEDELDGTGELEGEDGQDNEEFGEDGESSEAAELLLSYDEDGDKPAAATMGEFPEFTEAAAPREARGDGRGGGRSSESGREGHREGQRDSQRDSQRVEGGERSGRGGRGGRDRGGRDARGAASSRSNGGRPSRHSMQTTDLPAISDLLKPGQEVLVQIAKEPIAKKGARITSHIALPGRFLVFMPTVNHIGVSRKIDTDGERRRLKEILLSEKGEASGGFIVRTAASGATEEELRSDLRFLLNLWADIKQRSENSKAPALIYHDLNLVERILRDQVTDNFSAIWCDTEAEYERVLRFLQRFQPSLMRRVKLYTKDTPLFEQFGITEEINKALHSKVWLKSGGSIVINQTEALVAIDINTGKFVGKTARLEDTIVKTNLDAIPEIVRQIRLRDLGGIIVIDFIDMDDRKNRHRVLAALEEELKNDRAPSKVLQFNDFGLVAITRKRVKQSLERTLSTTCSICAGTGMTKSPITVCNEIYVELRKMHKQLDKGDVMLRVHPEVVKQLKGGNGKWLQEMEEIAGKTILIKSDPSLHPEQFDIH